MSLAVQQNDATEIPNSPSWCVGSTTIQKIVTFVTGLLLLTAGLVTYFIHLNSIASINPTASYVILGAGGSLILEVAIWSVVNWFQGRNLKQSEGFVKDDLSTSTSSAKKIPSNQSTIFGAEQWQKHGVEIPAASIPPIPEDFLSGRNEQDLLILIPGFSNIDGLHQLIQKTGCLITIGSMEIRIIGNLKKSLDDAAPKTPYWIIWKKDLGTFYPPKFPARPTCRDVVLSYEIVAKVESENAAALQAGFSIPTIYEATTGLAVQFLLTHTYPDCPGLPCEILITQGGEYRPLLKSTPLGLFISDCSSRLTDIFMLNKPLVKSSIEVRRKIDTTI